MSLTKFFYLSIILIVYTAFASCREKNTKDLPKRDFTQIKESGMLTAITLSSSVSYFTYKNEPMGYDYELLKNYADSHKLKLDIKLANNLASMLEMLDTGKGDLIAYHIPVTNEMRDTLNYCGKENINEQVLIQRANRRDTVLKDVTELIGKEVWVVNSSKFHKRLKNLNDELGGGIIIKAMEDTLSVEDLIEMVSKGKISYTFSDKNIALINKTYYPNIDVNLKVSHPQRSSWAVRKSSPQLAKSLNEWSDDNKNKPRYQAIIKRYFEMSKMPEEKVIQPMVVPRNGISPYDNYFKKYAPTIHWDWRLLASISYQESKFDTTALSWAGASGLMGLMPRTANAFGLESDNRGNPEENIRAATKYIQSLFPYFKAFESEEEKIKFVLASYNAGIGHIIDAQSLARKFDKNPMVWEGHVEECLKLKRLPEYYNDSVCKNGYFRGTETLNYVKLVMERWKYYQEKVKK